MKNILRKILIIFILLVSSISVLSLADNEVDNSESVNYNDEVIPISDDADDTSNVDASAFAAFLFSACTYFPL